jgi:bifunctional non-homologous end joining protein LigD
VACDDKGVASFDLIRHHRTHERVFLYAFDLIEINGDDLRRDPLEVRKATLRSMLAKAGLGLRFNEHLEGDGPTVFAHACKMGLEGIVSKRKDSPYRSGRSPHWLKMKNPAHAAVKRDQDGTPESFPPLQAAPSVRPSFRSCAPPQVRTHAASHRCEVFR